MRKFKFAAALVCAITAFALTAFAACKNAADVDAELLVSDEKLVVIRACADGGSLEDAMKSFSDGGRLNYEGSKSQYGLYLTSVNGYTPSGEEYWTVYTTLGDYDGVSYSDADYGVFEYDGEVCACAMFGVSDLPLVADNLYVLAPATSVY